MENNWPPALADIALSATKSVANQMGAHAEQPACMTTPSRPDAPAAWDSATLLGNQRSATIVHHGEAYRLQLTRQGKLILTK